MLNEIAKEWDCTIVWNRLEKYSSVGTLEWYAHSQHRQIKMNSSDLTRLVKENTPPTDDEIISLLHEIGHIALNHQIVEEFQQNSIYRYRLEAEAWKFCKLHSTKYSMPQSTITHNTLEALHTYRRGLSVKVRNAIHTLYGIDRM